MPSSIHAKGVGDPDRVIFKPLLGFTKIFCRRILIKENILIHLEEIWMFGAIFGEARFFSVWSMGSGIYLGSGAPGGSGRRGWIYQGFDSIQHRE